MRYILSGVVAGLCLATLQVQAATIQQTVASINADAAKPGGPERMANSISQKTGIPVATLEKQRAATGYSYGDLFAAHAIARASRKTFDQITALKAKGQTWDKIADDTNVSLGGKKKVVKAPAPRPAPSPTPRSAFDSLKARWSHETVVTNTPKVKKAKNGVTPTPAPFWPSTR